MATLGTFVTGQVLTASELNNAIPLCVLQNDNVTLTDGVSADIAYTSELTDDLGWHSNTTNTARITPNIAGIYLVTMVLNNVSGTTRALHGLFKNGAATTIPIFMDTTGTIDDFTVSGYINANGTTDYFTHRALVTGATKTGVKAQFSMQFIHP